MHNGFYREQDLIVEECGENREDIGFWFMDTMSFFNDPDLDDEVENMYRFLHGDCDSFAMMLSDAFGYGIWAIAGPGHIEHAWCRDGDLFIDARGITDDADEFWAEFEDFRGLAGDADYYENTAAFQEALEDFGMGEGFYDWGSVDRIIADPAFKMYDTANFR